MPIMWRLFCWSRLSVDDTRPVIMKDFGDERRETFHQHCGNEGDEHEVHVRMEGSNTRTKCLVVEPGRGFLQVREEVAQYLGRFPQALILLLDAGPDEPVQIVRRQRGKLPHRLVQYGMPIAVCST